MAHPIYLDNHATTALDPRVRRAMEPYFQQMYGNAGSHHAYGWEADGAIQKARQAIAGMLGAEEEGVIFTSGATEANNLAIKGVAEAYFGKGKHLVTVVTEHSAVLAPCRYLETLGFEVTYLPVDNQGLITVDQVSAVLRPDTLLLSVMAANNEIGVLQPLKALGQLCRERGVLFHTDGAQAIAKIPLNVEELCIDLLSFTAHKIHGPKGIGGLYRRPGVTLAPQLHGGGQENGIRSGTLPTPLIVGLAEALILGVQRMDQDGDRQRQLRDKLWHSLQSLGGMILNGDEEQRLPGNLNVSVEGVQGSALLLAIQPHIALSSGSACTKGSLSHVLTALGRSPTLARASLRFGLSRFTTEEDIDSAIAILGEVIPRLRQD